MLECLTVLLLAVDEPDYRRDLLDFPSPPGRPGSGSVPPLHARPGAVAILEAPIRSALSLVLSLEDLLRGSSGKLRIEAQRLRARLAGLGQLRRVWGALAPNQVLSLEARLSRYAGWDLPRPGVPATAGAVLVPPPGALCQRWSGVLQSRLPEDPRCWLALFDNRRGAYG